MIEPFHHIGLFHEPTFVLDRCLGGALLHSHICRPRLAPDVERDGSIHNPELAFAKEAAVAVADCQVFAFEVPDILGRELKLKLVGLPNQS